MSIFERPRRKRGLTVAFAAVLTLSGLVAVAGTAAGSVPRATTKCSGTPVKVMSIADISNPSAPHPEVFDGAQAAVKAVNAACTAGVPLAWSGCDDKASPNTAADCARQVVSEKPIAVTGQYNTFGDTIDPIIAGAGIPMVGTLGTNVQDNTNPYSFPLVLPNLYLASAAQVLKGLGVTKAALPYVDLSTVAALVNNVKTYGASLGVEFVPIPIPVTASDYASYAAQMTSAGTGAFGILTSPQLIGLLNALSGQATDLRKFPFVQASNVVTPDFMKRVGSTITGLDVVSSYWPVSDPSNSGVKQYQKEMKKAGFDISETSDGSFASWTAVHLVADELKGMKNPTSADLYGKLSALKAPDAPQSAPLDFTTPQLASIPAFATYRIPTHYVSLVQVTDGNNAKVVPLTTGFVDVLKPIKVKKNATK
jgi:branched-chain amino acid transport system substrate-binding protein